VQFWGALDLNVVACMLQSGSVRGDGVGAAEEGSARQQRQRVAAQQLRLVQAGIAQSGVLLQLQHGHPGEVRHIVVWDAVRVINSFLKS
jgi:hypothetical protein